MKSLAPTSIVDGPADVYIAPPSRGFNGIWYQITGGKGEGPEAWNANKYGGAMATYPQQHSPIAIRKTCRSAGIDRTYFVYGGFDGDRQATPNMISYFDHATGFLARPRTVLTRDINDAHENPTLAIDDDGFLFMFSPGHGFDRDAFITRSAEPWSIDRWQRVAHLRGGEPRETFSYAQPHFVPGLGFLVLNTHYQNGGNRTLYTNSSRDGIKWKYDWSLDGKCPRTMLAMMEHGQYQTSWKFGSIVATAFDMHPNNAPGTPLDYRTNLYYLETMDLGQTWQTADGMPVIDLPLIDPANSALVADYRPQGLNVYVKDVRRDALGQPIILFLTSHGPEAGPASGPRVLRTARYGKAEARWIIRDVLTTDHNYDHGSIYIEADDTGQAVWRLIGPWITGPQAFGTGGIMGVWTSNDQGLTWSHVDTLTPESTVNHSYARRPLDAGDDFYAFWSAGHAFEPGDVRLHFAGKDGQVYMMPDHVDSDFAWPIPLLR